MGFGIGLNLFYVPTKNKLKSNDHRDLFKHTVFYFSLIKSKIVVKIILTYCVK